ncbi:MAG: STAS domain-containing protein [Pseudobutyrivibrio ruminis]|uniref:Anti-sigma factor antagonist n=1 Tax=Pseudobutyrivibrio ruminis TaxID=46206 RepID=A0A927UD99_9FIRM|nr:STAS domain-containing protein [Pseudobutyrivibrio sp.]MBE5919988.1 STAS domain-containing protein [Pseudobutyrivibrio ruminis]MBQ6461886.1 STAS domain-containing protein [Pseudobutyrivibrio sp.]
MLNINILKDGEKAVYALEGRLDTSTAPQLEEAVNGNISELKDISFDFANLEYISSAGLRVLLSTQKTMNKQGKMVIKNVSEEVMEIFDVTGFSDILTIE